MNSTIIKTPSQCSKKELTEFEKMLRLAHERFAEWKDLTSRILAAKYLLFIPDDYGRFIAITSMKWPMLSYKKKIFRLSGSPLSSDDYDLEQGWTYIDPEFRRRGLAERLIGASISVVGNQHTTYATVHSSNYTIRRIVEDDGFIPSGNPFPSSFYGGEEFLYVQPPGSRWDGVRFS